MLRFRLSSRGPGPSRAPARAAPEAIGWNNSAGQEAFLASNPQHNNDEQRLALFIDFENIAIGVRDANYRKFDINLVLERLLEKGKVLVKRAYADWNRYSDYKRSFHEAAIELIEVPQKSMGGKNSADIRLVVDAMDMSLQKEHINCFVIASGDSDFSPLVSKLKENNKYVIGLGVKNSTSDLLMDNCDEFIFYEDLVRGQQRQVPAIGNLPEKQQEVYSLLVDSVLALQRENKEVLWGSMVKETMKRKKPSFNETYYGFRTFSHLLEEAQRKGIVQLRRDQKSGSYIVEDLGTGSAGTTRGEAVAALPPATIPARAPEPTPAAVAAPAAAPSPSTEAAEANGRARSRRRPRGRGRTRTITGTAGAGTPSEAPVEAAPDDVEEHDSPEEADGRRHDLNSEASAEARAPSTPAAAPAEPGEAQPHHDAGAPERPFSLFSWIRRDAPAREAESGEPEITPAKESQER
jgi:uncharacterized protein (TIGR00288 family)